MLALHRRVKGRELAEAIGVTPSAISARLSGDTAIKQEEVPALAQVLECPVEVLRLSPELALRWSRDHPRTDELTRLRGSRRRGSGWSSELPGRPVLARVS